jgi:hypothetical protein
MIGIVLILAAVVLIAVVIMINTKAITNKNKLHTSVPQTEDSAAQEEEEKLYASLKHEKSLVKDENTMSDNEYRNALKRLGISDEESLEKKTQSMNDNDYRNALKSMNGKQDR